MKAICKFDNWEGFDVVSVKISHIHDSSPATDSDFCQELAKSIEAEGLTNPLILVPSSPKELHKVLNRLNGNLDFPTNKATIFALFGGSSRLKVLKELGYTYVDCILLPFNDFSQVQRLQRRQRISYSNLYGRR